MADKNKRSSSIVYRKGLYLSILSGISLFLIFNIYSRNTAPENAIYINQTLYNFALSVFLSFFVFLSVFLVGIKKAFFPKDAGESNPSTLMYYIQSTMKQKNNKILFILITIVYFIFFAFLSNIFIYFNDDGTIFSLFSKPPTNDTHSENPMLHDNDMNNSTKENYLKNMTNNYYPKYNLIICCNSIGYVPMLILSINSNFSILLIPINFLLGVVISILVGFNITFNIYLIRQIKSLRLSKRNFYSLFGISSGLFVGCPTCAGGFFYSLAGFSSLITFSFLSIYQIIFVFISIPLLILSIIFMAKLLQKKYLESCKIK